MRCAGGPARPRKPLPGASAVAKSSSARRDAPARAVVAGLLERTARRSSAMTAPAGAELTQSPTSHHHTVLRDAQEEGLVRNWDEFEELDEQLGAGTYGVVIRVRRKRGSRLSFACKQPRAAFGGHDAHRLAELRDEFAALKRLTSAWMPTWCARRKRLLARAGPASALRATATRADAARGAARLTTPTGAPS